MNLKHQISKHIFIAHRGAMSEAPENTKAAFDKALSYPIDGFEFDVQLTKDEVPIIYHDMTTYKINGRHKKISQSSYSELERLDMGQWFSKKFAKEPLLTLEDVLSRYAAKTFLLIELKVSAEKKEAGIIPIFADIVLKAIDRFVAHNHLKHIFILSFESGILTDIQKKASHLKTVLNVEQPESLTYQNSMYKNLFAICSPIRKVNSTIVNDANAKGLKVLTYSCNTKQHVTKALNLNIYGILTDNPQWLTKYIATPNG